MTPTIRPEAVDDHEAIRQVNRLAFGQDDEGRIVDELRAGGQLRVSLVAEVEGQVVGHILFSDLSILTDAGAVPALALAPMAVLPEHQRHGIGSALVERGLELCRRQDHRLVVVLGHPGFYPRFGFSAKLAEALGSPFHAGDAWMALELVPGALEGVTGWVRYPPPFAPGPQVRPVYRPDQPEWVRLRTALWPTESVAELTAEAEAFLSLKPLATDTVFVADRPEGGLCGFVEVSIRPFAEDCATRPVGYVEGWFVDADLRRQGIGGKLIRAAEEWSRDRGCQEMASDALLDNTVSHQAHRALGFEETSRLVHFRKPLRRGED